MTKSFLKFLSQHIKSLINISVLKKNATKLFYYFLKFNTHNDTSQDEKYKNQNQPCKITHPNSRTLITIGTQCFLKNQMSTDQTKNPDPQQ